MRARELMSTPVVTIRAEATLKEVAKVMAAHRISGIPVVDRLDRLVGIISESDFLMKMEDAERGHGFPDRLARAAGADQRVGARTASDLMTPLVITAGPEATVRELTHLMMTHYVNRIPILESGRLVGIVARADILRTLTRHDTAITEEVKWRLGHELWIDTDGLEIKTADGVVTIAGTVDTRTDAELAARWTAATEGVVAVDTQHLHYRLDDHRIKVTTDRLR